MPKITSIGKYLFKLQLKMSGVFFWDTLYIDEWFHNSLNTRFGIPHSSMRAFLDWRAWSWMQRFSLCVFLIFCIRVSNSLCASSTISIIIVIIIIIICMLRLMKCDEMWFGAFIPSSGCYCAFTRRIHLYSSRKRPRLPHVSPPVTTVGDIKITFLMKHR